MKREGGFVETNFCVRFVYVLYVFTFSEDSELRRTLQSLACGKARVIIKNPKVYTIAP